MTAVPLAVSSSPGVKPQEGAGRLKNAYAEKTEQGARAPILIRRSAGLSTVNELDDINCRGLLALSTSMIDVREGQVYGVSRSALGIYTSTALGALSGTGPVTLARNAKSPTPDIVCVTEENGAFVLSLSAAPVEYPDVDLPFANSVSILNGKFLFTTRAGIIWASGLNTTAVASNAFAEAESRPDGLWRGVAFRGEFFAFGDESCDVYGDVAASPFPLEFKVTIPRGICGTHAIAGFEEGWSNVLCWVSDDDVVYQLNGYSSDPISNAAVSRAIAGSADKTALRASVYMAGGNAFWVLTDPGVWTWEYNLRTKAWNERESFGLSGWRIGSTCRAFERWLGGDRLNGNLSEILEGVYLEGDEPLVWEIESGTLANFPEQFAPARLDIDLTAAVGDEAGTEDNEKDPIVDISWSNDGGYSWGSPVQRKVGRQGKSKQQVSVPKLGRITPKGLKVRIRGADPVHYALSGITVRAR